MKGNPHDLGKFSVEPRCVGAQGLAPLPYVEYMRKLFPDKGQETGREGGVSSVLPSPIALVITLFSLMLSGCGIQFNSPAQILTGGINSQRADTSPAYSSDGRYLAFASDRDRSRDIFLYDLQQKRLLDLPNLNRRDSSQDQPALSSDGRFIVYVSNERGKTDILVYDRQTQRSQLLTGGIRGSVRHPTITGDGRYVAYETSQLGQWHIAIVELSVP